MQFHQRHLLGLIALLLVAAPAWGQRKLALVVGVNQYSSAPELQYSVADSQALERAFRSLGFDRVYVLNDLQKQTQHPNKQNIESALGKMLHAAKPADLIVFAFSGHGVAVDSRSYLCPMEAKLNDAENTMISFESIYRQMRDSTARQKLIVIDACRTASTDGQKKALAVSPAWSNATQAFDSSVKPEAEHQIAVLTSCSFGQFSYESEILKQGVFTHALVDQMRGRAVDSTGQIVVSRLFSESKSVTAALTSKYPVPQEPRLMGNIHEICLGRYTTIIDEDFSTSEIGGLPVGKWDGDPDAKVDLAMDGKKFLCSVGDGGWVQTDEAMINGDFELRTTWLLSARGYSELNIALDWTGAENPWGIQGKFDPNDGTLSLKCGAYSWKSTEKNRTSYFNLSSWHSAAAVKVTPGNAPQQFPVEISLRRSTVRSGQSERYTYEMRVNDGKPIIVARDETPGFTRLGFYIDEGEEVGLRRLQVFPITE